MRARASRHVHAVLTADIVGSRSLERLAHMRAAKLRSLSSRHQEEQLIAAPYAVTAGDEFQGVLVGVDRAPRLIFDLRVSFLPLELRIGVGIGELSSRLRKGRPVNLFGGEAFERAREAIQSLKSGIKYDALTAFRSPDSRLDRTLNLIYRLHDSLVREITPVQWATIEAHTRTASGELGDTARRLRKSPSTVSRNLRRGHYWQLRETAQTVEAILHDELGGT